MSRVVGDVLNVFANWDLVDTFNPKKLEHFGHVDACSFHRTILNHSFSRSLWITGRKKDTNAVLRLPRWSDWVEKGKGEMTEYHHWFLLYVAHIGYEYGKVSNNQF